SITLLPLSALVVAMPAARRSMPIVHGGEGQYVRTRTPSIGHIAYRHALAPCNRQAPRTRQPLQGAQAWLSRFDVSQARAASRRMPAALDCPSGVRRDSRFRQLLEVLHRVAQVAPDR